MEPDVQEFLFSGWWVKPRNAVWTDVMLVAGSSPDGPPAQQLLAGFVADALPDRAQVKVGTFGYAEFVTYLAEPG